MLDSLKRWAIPGILGVLILSFVLPGLFGPLGDIYHPQGNPIVNRYSDTLDVRGPTIVVAASDSLNRFDVEPKYRCDGTADEVQIQRALDDLPDTGGTVQLLEGIYYTSDSIKISGSHKTLQGQGITSTRLFIQGYANNSPIAFADNSTQFNVRISDMLITAEGEHMDSYAIYAPTVDRCIFERLSLKNGKAGIYFEARAYGGSCYRNVVRDVCVQGCLYGVYLDQESGASYQPNSNRFENLYIDGDNIAGSIGVYVAKGAHDIWVGGCITECDIGMRFDHGDQHVYHPYIQLCNVGIYAHVPKIYLLWPHVDGNTTDYDLELGEGSYVFSEEEGTLHRMHVWLADDTQNGALGTLIKNSFVTKVWIHVTEAFNSDGTNQIRVGYDGDEDAFGTLTNVSTTGMKDVTLGVLAGFNGTQRDVEAYYVNGGSEPTAGKACIILEYYLVPNELA